MRLVFIIPWLWLALFVAAPLAIVMAIALAEPADSVPPYILGWHLENLALVVLDPFYRDALLTSLRVAFVSTVACLFIGYPMALGIARLPPGWRNMLLLAAVLPFWTGFLMRINAWIGLLRDDGPIDTLSAWIGFAPPRLLYTDFAMYLGIVYTYLPFMVLPLFATLSRRDIALEEAAADLGASPIEVFWRIVLPMSVPGIVAGCALVFIPVVGEYVIPELLGPPSASLVGRVVWGEFFANRDWPTASALAVALLAILLAPIAAYRRWGPA
jgi:putrescine transport system permease protein